MMIAGTCELCGDVCWLHDGRRWVHPCCALAIERDGRARCEGCDIAASERRRWEARQGSVQWAG